MEELLDTIPLVDHHCHSVTVDELSRAEFEAYLTEAHHPSTGMSMFDTPLGVSVRRWCAPLLDLEPHADPDSYMARRRELGAHEVTSRFLSSTRVSDLLVDGGYRSESLLGMEGLAESSGARVHEVLRLESLAETVARDCPPKDFEDQFASALADRTSAVKALKSVVAYRYGLDLGREPPSHEDVLQAIQRWQRLARPTGEWHLTDPVLLRFVLWAAAGLGHRLQLHTGLGDPDLRLQRADPALLTDFLKVVEPTGTTVLLLHCWPYHRQAAFLAAIYPHVFLDVGLVLNHVGPRATSVLAESMEIAPYQKLLYSSDGFGVAELHYLGALRFRRSLSRVLGDWVAADEMDNDYAAWVARAVGANNARLLYGIGPGPPDADLGPPNR